MKSVLEKSTREELIHRITALSENSTAQWGKITIENMLKHCTKFEEKMLGKKIYKRSFMGRIFGKIALRGMIKDDKPLKKNMPTIPTFRKMEECLVPAEKERWIQLIKEYENFSNDNFVHTFFGKMTKEQIGYFAYKHSDHHLRQFNV